MKRSLFSTFLLANICYLFQNLIIKKKNISKKIVNGFFQLNVLIESFYLMVLKKKLRRLLKHDFLLFSISYIQSKQNLQWLFFADTLRNVELQILLLVLTFLWGVKLPRSNYDFNLKSAFIFLLGNEIEFQNVEMLFCIWTLTEVRLGNRLGYLRLGYLRLG